MVLVLVITKVVFTCAPKYVELALGFEVLESVKMHIYGFSYFLLEGDFGEDIHGGVINLESGGGLWVPHLDEACTQRDSILGVDIGGIYFDLRR